MLRANLQILVMALVVSTATGLHPVRAMDMKVTQPAGPDLTKARELIEAKNWPVAIVELKKLESTAKADADVYNLLGFTHRKQKLFEPALAYYQKALNLNPKHLGAHVYLGELYLETGKIDKAIAQSKVLAKLCPQGCKENKELQAALKAAGY